MKYDRFYSMSYSDPLLRLIWEPWLKTTTALYPPARRDPIFTPLFAAAFTSLGFTAGTVGVLSGIATGIATTALSVGLNILLAPKPPAPEDGKIPITQAIPPRQWVVGRTRVAGAYMLWEAKGSALCAVQAIAGHRIQAVNRWWLHDDEVTIDEDLLVTGEAARYSGRVRLDHRLGTPSPDPYDIIVEVFADDDEPIWTSAHLGVGQASIAMRAYNAKAEDQPGAFPYGAPRVSVEIDGARCWDPRDEDQDPDSPSTWLWTRNGALILLWHQCFNEFGHRRNYRKAILPVLDMWKEEADVCDENVPLSGGGTQKRYWVSGFDTTEHDPKVGTNAILSAMDGWLCERGDGALLLTVGKFRETRVATLTDADIIGHHVQYGVLPEEDVNRLVPKFTYPATDYTTADTDYFEDTDEQLELGRVLSEDGNYTWCHQWQQARRLGLRDWRRLKQKVKGSLDLRLAGINAVYSRWIRMDTPIRLPKLHGKLIENRRSILAITKGGFSLEFVRHPEDIDDWDPDADEGEPPPVPEAPNAYDLSAPIIDSVVARASGGSVFLRVSIEEPESDDLSLNIRYRLSDDGTGHPGDWVEKIYSKFVPTGGFIKVSTEQVPADEDLDVQAAWVAANGYYSDYSISETVLTVSDPVAPDPVTLADAVGGSGTANFTWKAPNSGNYWGAKIYWNTTNNFGTASYIGPVEHGAPKNTDSAIRTLPTGALYGWITAVNRSGIESSPDATGSFTVT